MLADGFDWWEEALDMNIPPSVWESLKERKNKAIELDETRCTPIAVKFGGMDFQLMPTGAAGGREFVLINESYRIEMSSPNKGWCIKWRATNAALWEGRIADIREILYAALAEAGCTPSENNPDDYIRLSRVDYCFDIHSKAFTRQMYPDIVYNTVCPSETKARGDFVVQGTQLETLTIGMASSCQVQIYDKTKEITEASNKTWLYDIWAVDTETGEIGEDIKADVWRLEIRLKKDWLKSRKVNRPDAFMSKLGECLADALYNRRLCQRTGDSNRRRWPLHPLYSMALDRIGNPQEFLPIDRRPTGRRSELVRIVRQNMAGSLRSLTTLLLLERGAFDEEEAERLAKTIFLQMLNDPEHEEKIRRAGEKYALVDAAK